MSAAQLHYKTADIAPARFETVASDSINYPQQYANLISIDVIHDGEYIPPAFLTDSYGNKIDHDTVLRQFIEERDWGANLVAARLAQRLGLQGFLTVNTARCLMDFGRFPGSTRHGATHLGRFAINLPFADKLGFLQKRKLLEYHYDEISNAMDKHVHGKLLKIAIHTYDRYNSSGTERPHVSLVSRMQSYQLESKMPFGVFDPLFPDILAEFTVDRVLRDRISLILEKNHFPVAHNYPYLLPVGSTEVRYQVWRFFQWLQERYEQSFPETKEKQVYKRVWEMLQDTNLRSAKAGELRSVLHMYRRAPIEEAAFFNRIITAYQNISAFVQQQDQKIIAEYRQAPNRCMSLGIEVRKDLLWDFDKNHQPVALNPSQGLKVADIIAEAIAIYLRKDRPEMGRDSIRKESSQ